MGHVTDHRVTVVKRRRSIGLVHCRMVELEDGVGSVYPRTFQRGPTPKIIRQGGISAGCEEQFDDRDGSFEALRDAVRERIGVIQRRFTRIPARIHALATVDRTE